MGTGQLRGPMIVLRELAMGPVQVVACVDLQAPHESPVVLRRVAALIGNTQEQELHRTFAFARNEGLRFPDDHPIIPVRRRRDGEVAVEGVGLREQ